MIACEEKVSNAHGGKFMATDHECKQQPRLIDLERDLVGITISVYESNNVTLTNHHGDNVGV